MAQKNVHYSHTIGFRVTDEAWFAIQREISNTDLTPHDWCHLMVLGLPQSRIWLDQEGTHFLRTISRRPLTNCQRIPIANDRLTTKSGKSTAYSRQKIDVIADRALEALQLGKDSKL
jgi:hypothetical protein